MLVCIVFVYILILNLLCLGKFQFEMYVYLSCCVTYKTNEQPIPILITAITKVSIKFILCRLYSMNGFSLIKKYVININLTVQLHRFSH